MAASRRRPDPGSQGRTHRCGGGTDCLGVLVVVPGSLPWRAVDRSGPADQVRHVGAWVALAHCGRRLSAAVRRIWSDDAPLGRHRVWWPANPPAGAQAAAAARTAGTSTRMPGPMVLAMVSERRYWPLAPAGLARLTASTRAARLSTIAVASKLLLPTGTWMMAALSTLNSTRPPLTSRDRALEVEGDGAGLGVRHQAAAAEDLAEPADQAHRVGRRERDVELEPAGLDLLDQVLATDLVGTGAQRLLGLLALGEDGDADDLARAVRQDDRAADHLVGVAGVDAEAEVRLDRRVEVDGRRLLERARPPRPGCRAVSRSTSLAASRYFLPCWLMWFLLAAGGSGLPRGDPWLRGRGRAAADVASATG